MLDQRQPPAGFAFENGHLVPVTQPDLDALESVDFPHPAEDEKNRFKLLTLQYLADPQRPTIAAFAEAHGVSRAVIFLNVRTICNRLRIRWRQRTPEAAAAYSQRQKSIWRKRKGGEPPPGHEKSAPVKERTFQRLRETKTDQYGAPCQRNAGKTETVGGVQ